MGSSRALAISLVALAALGHAHAAPRPGVEPVPVVVELFSSEGCSSCPSADLLLARLVREQPIPGVRIVPLELHVDYWDDLGWADPFAQAAFTERQRRYAAARRGGRVYTPALVVAGGVDLVGSDAAGVRAAITLAARTRPALTLTARVIRASAREVEVELVAGPRGEAVELVVALTEAGLATDVQRGENAGRRLAHAPIVRALVHAPELSAGASPARRIVRIARPPGARASSLRVIAFAQRPGPGAIVASAEAPLN